MVLLTALQSSYTFQFYTTEFTDFNKNNNLYHINHLDLVHKRIKTSETA